MGFNPYREERRSLFDYVAMIVALVVIAGLVAWALFG